MEIPDTKKEIRFVIFDCENILVNTDTVLVSVLLDAAEKKGACLDIDHAIKLFGGKPLIKCIKVLEDFLAKRFSDSEKQAVNESFIREMACGLAPREGIRDFLKTLKAEYCLLSTLDKTSTGINLALSGLDRYFRGKIRYADKKNYLHYAADTAVDNGYLSAQTLICRDRIEKADQYIKQGFTLAGLQQPDMDPQYQYPYNSIDELNDMLTIR